MQQNGEKHRAWFNIDNGNDKVPNGTGAEGLQRGDGTSKQLIASDAVWIFSDVAV